MLRDTLLLSPWYFFWLALNKPIQNWGVMQSNYVHRSIYIWLNVSSVSEQTIKPLSTSVQRALGLRLMSIKYCIGTMTLVIWHTNQHKAQYLDCKVLNHRLQTSMSPTDHLHQKGQCNVDSGTQTRFQVVGSSWNESGFACLHDSMVKHRALTSLTRSSKLTRTRLLKWWRDHAFQLLGLFHFQHLPFIMASVSNILSHFIHGFV